MSALNYRTRTRPPLSRSAIVIWSAIVGFAAGWIAMGIARWL